MGKLQKPSNSEEGNTSCFVKRGKIFRGITVNVCAISSELHGVGRTEDRCDPQALCRNFKNFGVRKGFSLFSEIIALYFLLVESN
jgi:hypothetical protein